jgi:hypothetical protein
VSIVSDLAVSAPEDALSTSEGIATAIPRGVPGPAQPVRVANAGAHHASRSAESPGSPIKSGGLEVHNSLLNMVLHETPQIRRDDPASE